MTTPKDRPDLGPIEVIPSVQRRRRWTPEEKRAIWLGRPRVNKKRVYRILAVNTCSFRSVREGPLARTTDR